MIPEPDLLVPPDDFVGRNQQIDAFRQALQQGLIAGRTSSFAVLGDSGVGKSSLLLKFGALCSEPSVAMLPVFVSALNDIHDYLRFAETLLDKFVDALLTWPKMQTHVRRELQNWRFKRANLGRVGSERETSRLFLSSGSSFLRGTLKEAWDRSLRLARLNGAIFFVDDLQNIRGIGKADLALAITNQFRSFGVEGMNYSICFSATADYLAQTKGPADPVARFYTKLHLEPFPVEETVDYVRSVFSTSLDTTARIAAWLHGKTLGHPSFVAFACRHLAAHESKIQLGQLETIWPAIFDQLGIPAWHFATERQGARPHPSICELGCRRVSIQSIHREIPKRILRASGREAIADPHKTGTLQALPPTVRRVSATNTMNESNCKSEDIRAVMRRQACRRVTAVPFPLHHHRAESIPLTLPAHHPFP